VSNVFTDPHVRPDPDTVRAALGEAAETWDAVNDMFAEVAAEVTWRHYRDGGWLAKATHRGKTLAWVTVHRGVLHVSFHFSEQLRGELIEAPGLSPKLHERLARAPVSGQLFSIPLDLRTSSNVAEVEELVALKLHGQRQGHRRGR
jgi:hypothetical protein